MQGQCFARGSQTDFYIASNKTTTFLSDAVGGGLIGWAAKGQKGTTIIQHNVHIPHSTVQHGMNNTNGD